MTSSQAQAESRSQRVLQAAREKETSDAISMKRKELADLGQAFEKMLASQQVRWAKEEQEHGEAVDQRRTEIEALEEKRLKALKPIDEKEYRDLIAAGKRVIEEYEKRQDECERTQAVLEKRLDETYTKEEENQRFANHLQARLSGVELQEEQSRRGAKFVSDGMETLRKERMTFDTDCAKRIDGFRLERKELNERTIALDAREKGLREREDRIVVLEAMYNSPINQSPVRKF